MQQRHDFEPIYLKVIFGGLAGVILLGAIIAGGLHFYHRWQDRHLPRVAEAYLSGGDLRAASLTARRALQIDPENADAARVMAEVAEKVGDPSTMQWWRKVYQLRPDSHADALALVRAAVRFRDVNTAEKTLGAISGWAENEPDYHAARAQLAEMQGRKQEAEEEWQRAVALAPNLASFRLHQAMLRLYIPEKRDAAKAVLMALRQNEGERALATRALIAATGKEDDPAKIRALAKDLQSYPEATFADRIVYLEILRQLHDPEFDSYFADVKERAARKADDLAALIAWSQQNDQQEAVMKFAEGLPAARLQEWPVPLTRAETYALRKDWRTLEKLANGPSWGKFDFLRHAFLARALKEQQQEAPADREWETAKKDAAADPASLLLLTRAVSGWGWTDRTQDLLWELAKLPETRVDAVQELYQHYARIGDTLGLYRALARALEIAPDDRGIQNNFAQVSLLLDLDRPRATQLAAGLAKAEPTNPAYVSTYAFALLKSGKAKDALGVMGKLSEQQLQQPAVALYYGIILAANGDAARAQEYLDRTGGAYFLPEEKKLLEKAKTSLP
ncbi:MAG: hypothetical protein M3R59_09645 [Verrucomicrobiota bacterium]|nr:hypothetical protein [Verrucomicrobiota bacterium]